MNLSFKELKCPCCGEEMEQGMCQISHDTQMVKRCSSDSCDFWMIIVIPNKEYDYTINSKKKGE